MPTKARWPDGSNTVAYVAPGPYISFAVDARARSARLSASARGKSITELRPLAIRSSAPSPKLSLASDDFNSAGLLIFRSGITR